MNMKTVVTELLEQGVEKSTLKQVVEWVQANPVPVELKHMIPTPDAIYIGEEVIDTIQAILAGKHIILEGAKGAGKNTLIDTIAYLFSRPVVQFPFNADVDVSMIVGTDTLGVDDDGHQVISFRKHQLVQAMEVGAWFVGDEINMTRADVLAVLHMVTDHRALLDYPGLGQVKSNPGFRFFGTMNYGYMGTAELNEAFADRFAIIHIPCIKSKNLIKLLKDAGGEDTIVTGLVKAYYDLEGKATRGEISSRSVSVRGMLDIIKLLNVGMPLRKALMLTLVNKSFDSFEKTQIKDALSTLFTLEPAKAKIDIESVPERSKK